MLFRQIADPGLAQYAYLVGCQRTGEALLIDPQRDVDRYDRLAADEGLRITTVAETHIHADYLSGAREYAERPDLTIVLSREGGPDWQYRWVGSGQARYVMAGHCDRFTVGHIDIDVRHTPGHTPEHLVLIVTDRGSGASEPIGAATGDFLLVGDVGRPDLLESAAGEVGAMRPAAIRLASSLQQVQDWPEFMQVWPGHGAGSACGKALGAVPFSTVGYERRYNGPVALAAESPERFVDAVLAGQPEPPPYFARMKQLNRDGVPLLGQLPAPPRWSIADVAERPDAIVVDTRRDRRAFMRAHLPGSLYAPASRLFTAAVGALLEPAHPFVLVAGADDVANLVRQLVRIGLDDVVGWIEADDIERWAGSHQAASSIPVVTFEDVAQSGNAAWVDVRSASEYANDHLPDAVHVPQSRLAVQLARIPRDRPIAVHCASGARAAIASAYLRREGFDVRYVDDDFAKWRQRKSVSATMPQV